MFIKIFARAISHFAKCHIFKKLRLSRSRNSSRVDEKENHARDSFLSWVSVSARKKKKQRKKDTSTRKDSGISKYQIALKTQMLFNGKMHMALSTTFLMHVQLKALADWRLKFASPQAARALLKHN
jgi:hypothetical protein